MAALGTYSRFEHPITQERTDTKRVAILVVTSDRGMAGAYSATILRETGRLIEELVKEGKEPVIFTFGRRAQSYFSFRGTPIEFSWTGQSDRPSDEAIEEVATTLLDYFQAVVISNPSLYLDNGTKAPDFSFVPYKEERLRDNLVRFYRNHHS